MIKCPGCGAEIDTEKNIAEFQLAPQPETDEAPPIREDSAATPASANRPRGNAFFRPVKKE